MQIVCHNDVSIMLAIYLILQEKENRKRELAELLTEHAHLVHEVETLQEGSTDSPDAATACSADNKENETLDSQTENTAEQ